MIEWEKDMKIIEKLTTKLNPTLNLIYDSQFS